MHYTLFSQQTYHFLLQSTDGFPIAEAWIDRNRCSDSNERHAKVITMINSYLEFLDWDSANEYPELMSMDLERILALAGRALRLTVWASTLAMASSVPIIGQQTANRNELSKQIDILLQNVNNDKYVPLDSTFLF